MFCMKGLISNISLNGDIGRVSPLKLAVRAIVGINSCR